MKSLLLTLVVIVAPLGSALAQDAPWRFTADPAPTAVTCPEPAFCFAATCSNGTGILGIVHRGGAALTDKGVLSVRVDDRLGFLISLQDGSVSEEARYGAPLFDGEGPRMIDALISGSRATLSYDTAAGRVEKILGLRGSARALRAFLRACPITDRALDPSDQAVAPSQNRPDTATSGGAAASMQPVDIIDRLFLSQDCVATESQLYQAIDAALGFGNAQPLLLAWSSAPDFTTRYEILSREPFTYRWRAGACAGR